MAKPRFREPRKKVSPIRAIKVSTTGHEGATTLRKLISGRGKIRTRHVTGVSVQE